VRNIDWRGVFKVLHDSGQSFGRHNDSLLAGAIAFYAMLSAAPLAVMAVAVAGLVFGQDTARGELYAQLKGPLGPQAAQMITNLMEQAREPISGGIATILGGIALLFGASRLFTHLHRALNHVMGVRSRIDLSWAGMLKQEAKLRLLALGMVFFCGLLLVALLVARTVLTAVTSALDQVVQVPLLWRGAELALSFGVLAVLFTFTFRLLPDVVIKWTDVWVGAWFTAILVGLGTIPIGWFIGNFGVASAYGAAGSLVVILLWIYYSSHIFFFGAEFTRSWATHYGRGVRPHSHATRILFEDLLERGSGANGEDESKSVSEAGALVNGPAKSAVEPASRGLSRPPAASGRGSKEPSSG
jgi:membrane protein